MGVQVRQAWDKGKKGQRMGRGRKRGKGQKMVREAGNERELGVSNQNEAGALRGDAVEERLMDKEGRQC